MNRLQALAVGLLLPVLLAFAPRSALADYVGDYAVGTDNICTIANTYQPSTGAVFALASAAVRIPGSVGKLPLSEADRRGFSAEAIRLHDNARPRLAKVALEGSDDEVAALQSRSRHISSAAASQKTMTSRSSSDSSRARA